MKKLILGSLMVFMLIMSMMTISYADDGIKVLVDGSYLQFDSQPIIENGTTLVPLRQIFEAIGADVSWDKSTQTVTATRDNEIVKLTVGDTTAYKNGESINISIAPKIINNRTYVPLRFVAESFGANVDWDKYTKVVTINSFYKQDDYDPNYKETEYVPYSTSNLETLANALLAGNVVVINGDYYATPEYATKIYHAFYVSNDDISMFRDGEYTENKSMEDYDWVSGNSFRKELVPDYELEGVDLSMLEEGYIKNWYFVYGFYEPSGDINLIYAVPDMTEEFMNSQNATGTFSGIDMSMEDGILFYSIPDLLERGIPIN